MYSEILVPLKFPKQKKMISIFSASLVILVLTCLLISILLIGYSLKTRSYNLLLALFFILLSYPYLILVLVDTNLIEGLPHVYRTSLIAQLLSIPVSYLYIRCTITNKGLTKLDFIHLIPVLIYVIDYYPFFLLSGAGKTAIMYSLKLNREILFFNESRFFRPGFYIVFKYVLSFAYWVAQVILLVGFYRGKKLGFSKENCIYLIWFSTFILSQVFLFFPSANILKLDDVNDKLIWFLFIGGPTGLFTLLLFLFPRILFGIRGIQFIDENPVFIEEKDTSLSLAVAPNQRQTKSSKHLSHSKMKEIALMIKKHIDSEKSYLDTQYSLRQLSDELSIPAQYISAVINECENVNFNDFINAYRIKYCVRLLNKNNHRNQTLEAIAVESGFNNRNTFTIAFKKIMGQTPSVYIKNSDSVL